MQMEYDGLVKNTSRELSRLSEFLGTEITMSHWNEVYNDSGTRFSAVRDRLLAIMIYLKNYRQRFR